MNIYKEMQLKTELEKSIKLAKEIKATFNNILGIKQENNDNFSEYDFQQDIYNFEAMEIKFYEVEKYLKNELNLIMREKIHREQTQKTI